AKGLGPSLARGALAAAAIPYSAITRLRNVAYDRGLFPAHAVEVPVVCIGNLTLGGTGKTPLVRYLASKLLAQGIRPGIVSRGYGSKSGEPNDEAIELALSLPNVLHVQNRDRFAAAKELLSVQAANDAESPNLIILDDGFQHRRLKRDMDVVLLD